MRSGLVGQQCELQRRFETPTRLLQMRSKLLVDAARRANRIGGSSLNPGERSEVTARNNLHHSRHVSTSRDQVMRSMSDVLPEVQHSLRRIRRTPVQFELCRRRRKRDETLTYQIDNLGSACNVEYSSLASRSEQHCFDAPKLCRTVRPDTDGDRRFVCSIGGKHHDRRSGWVVRAPAGDGGRILERREKGCGGAARQQRNRHGAGTRAEPEGSPSRGPLIVDDDLNRHR